MFRYSHFKVATRPAALYVAFMTGLILASAGKVFERPLFFLILYSLLWLAICLFSRLSAAELD